MRIPRIVFFGSLSDYRIDYRRKLLGGVYLRRIFAYRNLRGGRSVQQHLACACVTVQKLK